MQQALLQHAGQGMALGHTGLGVSNVIFDVGAGGDTGGGSAARGGPYRPRSQPQMDPSMMYQAAYVPELGMGRLGRGLRGMSAEDYAHHTRAGAAAAFQQGAAEAGDYPEGGGGAGGQQPQQGAGGPSDTQSYPY